MAMVGSIPAFAHGFHYRIAVDTTLVMDAQGQLNGLQMHWLHDADVSKAMFEDEDMSPEHRDQTIKQIGNRLVHDLQRLGYFTQLKLDGQAVPIGEVQTHTLTVDSKQQMLLDFVLPLQSPVSLSGKTLSWTMQDPEGMGILTYAGDSHVSLPEGCQLQLATPPASTNPDDEASHPQTVTVSCP